MNNYIDEIKEVLDKIDLTLIDDFVNLLGQDKNIYSCGCGGAFNISQHWAEDCISYLLNKQIPGLGAVALGSNGGLVTAIANDYGPDHIFVQEMYALGAFEGDLLVIFTGSGNSTSLIRAAEHAEESNMKIICFTGFNGGLLGKMADIHINIPSDKWSIIHSLQSFLFHVVLDKYIEKQSSK